MTCITPWRRRAGTRETVLERLNPRVAGTLATLPSVDMSNVEDVVTVPKTEHSDEGSFSETSPEVDEQSFRQENAQVQKRKGGRKPVGGELFHERWLPLTGSTLQIYATSEERKQRNRQAQAAFRERRTEYIKQLETTIKHHEEKLQNLQQSHRAAADECLMLRYKNSLLERILVEKGKRFMPISTILMN